MPKDIKQMNNEEFLGFLMTSSPFGAMTQTFIIEAIRYYSEAVTKQPRPEEDTHQIINPALWYDVANDVKARLNAKYGE